MVRRFIAGGVLAVALILGGRTASAECYAFSGRVVWNSWRIDWSIESYAGVVIKNVSFGATNYIWRASLPAVRVNYAGYCQNAPFVDRIGWSDIVEENCQKIRVEQYGSYLKIWVLAYIGSYILKQGYYFWNDGYVDPFLESSGLQCVLDHRHHAYWRLDFDVAGSGSDEVGTVEYGSYYNRATEFNDIKGQSSYYKHWTVRDYSANRFVQIEPGYNDWAEPAYPSFSSMDFAGRLLKSPTEHEPWPAQMGPGDAPDHLLNSNNGENIYQKDIVVWYVSHLLHYWVNGPNQAVSVGPWIRLY
jgi:hypothetical protein